MLHDNSTPLAAIGFEQLKPDGSPMAVIAARGSFEIVEGVIRYTPTQELVFADVFEGDPQRTPLVRVGDLIRFKPAADVTVLGVIQSPQAVAVLRAGLRVTGRGAVLETQHQECHKNGCGNIRDNDTKRTMHCDFPLTTKSCGWHSQTKGKWIGRQNQPSIASTYSRLGQARVATKRKNYLCFSIRCWIPKMNGPSRSKPRQTAGALTIT